MNTFTQSITKIFEGAGKAFRLFPASIGCALAFTFVTMIRIQLDWKQQEPLNFLFNCLHWSFAFGAILSLALIVAERSRINKYKANITANLLTIAITALAFCGLYFYGSKEILGASYEVISSLAVARVSAAILVSFIAFIILAGYSSEEADFTSSFFMTHKAFFIALIYGAVIMAGAMGVAGTVQSLLYHGMSSKVYMYISTIAGFVTFTIFVGYFPDFRNGKDNEHRKAAQKQPRFIEILFLYIMIPIVLTLTIVLLIWTAKSILGGMQVSFVRLSAIAASYTLGGLWLHAMVKDHRANLAEIFRRVYPIASLLILVFEAWAVIKQLGYSGLKSSEYVFIMIWIIAAAGAVLILIKRRNAHQIIAEIICVLAVLSVFPLVGYYALPVTAQVSRLEVLLVGQHMLENNKLSPAVSEPQEEVRVAVTDAVIFLANADNAKMPIWFDRKLGEGNVFKSKLGFEQTWEKPEETGEVVPNEYLGTFLYLPSEAIDISDYSLVISPQNNYKTVQDEITVEGEKGEYHIFWTTNNDTGIPSLRVSLEDRVILENNMEAYVDSLSKKYPPGQAEPRAAALEDMSLQLESPEISILLVFNYIEISVDTRNDVTSYGLDLKSIYIRENP